MPAPAAAVQLVQAFEANEEAYRSEPYKEASVRREFIDPLFEALGWDVQNRRKYAENYKDVVHEPSLDEEVSSGAPDYSFQPGGQLKFYVEAKKPSVRLHRDPAPAHQVRMYGWTKQLPICLLTNFAELAVYDCRVEPRPADMPEVARVDYLSYRQYTERWDDLVRLFSPEAVFRGSFDRFVETRHRRGAAPFDQRFLDDLEGWRKRLAENIALRNPGLSEGDLNYSVQQTIDRIVFLRICEARAIEPFGRLRDIAKLPDIYQNLVHYFRAADDAYNSGLFHFRREQGREQYDELTPSLLVDDAILRAVIRQLYWPERPYAFEVVPADILGQVYERFLGNVVYLTPAHHARVREKPEVKRAGGVYYTPTYVVDYIVERTLGRQLGGKSWKQASGLRVVDPACGSGSFLLGAYEFLVNWYRDQYVADGVEKHKKQLYQTPAGWKLAIDEKKNILLNHIFGVDIDPQAVEVTKLSLLLKVLEGESEQTVKPRLIREPALPDLDSNIKCGNSLVGADLDSSVLAAQLNDEDKKQANPFDWRSAFSTVRDGKFDVVIGNPPYDVIEKERGAASWPHDLLAEYAATSVDLAPAFGGKLNLFRFFVVKSLALLKNGGRYGMIMPLALLGDVSCANTRHFLITHSAELEADCFPQKDNASKRIFRDAKLSTVVITCMHSATSSDDPEIYVRTYPWKSFNDSHKESVVKLSEAKLLDPKNAPIPLVDQQTLSVCLKLHKMSGVVPLSRVPSVSITRGEINQSIYRAYIDDDSSHARLVKGVEVSRYGMNHCLSQGSREWFDEPRFVRTHQPKHIVGKRRIATQRITGVDEKLRVVATIIEPPAYFADSTNSVACDDPAHTLEYILALLNSRLFQWRFKLTSTNNNVATNELAVLPVMLITPETELTAARIRKLAKQMLDYRCQRTPRNPNDREAFLRKFAFMDRKMDALVYDLYGLNKDERRLVESVTTVGALEAAESEE